MKMHSNEQPGPVEPQLPLQASLTPEKRSKRGRRRGKKSIKLPLAEAVLSREEHLLETEVQPNEVRLIWDREGAERPKPPAKEGPKLEKAPEKKPLPIAEQAANRPKKIKKIETPAFTEAEVETPKPKREAEESKAAKPVERSVKPAKPTAETLEVAPEELPAERDQKYQFNPDDFVDMPELAPPQQPMIEPKSQNFVNMPPRPEEIAEPSYVPLPPSTPQSYRHFFWNEPTITSPGEAMAEHSMLPSVGQRPLEQQSYASAEPTARSNAASAEPFPELLRHHETEQTPTTLAHEATMRSPALEAVPLHGMHEPQLPEFASHRRHEADHTDLPSTLMVSAEEVPAPEGLALPELMKLSKRITVDGVKLSEIFAAKRIDEASLRAVVQEYLRGGDVRRALTREIINHEKDFERDPELRHKRRAKVRSAVAHASAKTIQKTYQLGKSSKKLSRGAAHAVIDIASQTHRELEASGISIHWPSIIAIVVIYSLILILLLA